MSLIEMVISSLIVSLMLVAALTAVGSSARAGRIHSTLSFGSNLARQLLSEVLEARYVEPDDTPRFGPEPGERRSSYDDVDDYHTWQASPPEARDGTPLTGAEGWTREVRVDYVLPADPASRTGTDRGLKRITVTATSPQGKQTTLRALRSSSGPYDQQPEAETTFVRGVTVELQIGPVEAARLSSGTHVLNPVPASP